MKKKKCSENRFILCWLLIIAALSVVMLGSYLYYIMRPADKSEEKVQTERPEKRMAIVIDDLGHDLDIVRDIIQMKSPLTLAILPGRPFSREVAELAFRGGLETLLHLPMEPHGYPEKNPGNNALFLSMSNEDIQEMTAFDIAAVPHIAGVNNHMGSLFMENEDKLEVVFDELKRNGLFFLDCWTTRKSRGRQVARKAGIPFFSRDLFIDNGKDTGETRSIIGKAIENRKKWKTLILVGHPYISTIDAIRDSLPLLESHDISIVPLSKLGEGN